MMRRIIRERSTMLTNGDLRQLVLEELYWDPKIDAEAVAVVAEDGEA
jgi:hypothetical protein